MIINNAANSNTTDIILIFYFLVNFNLSGSIAPLWHLYDRPLKHADNIPSRYGGGGA